MLLQAERMTEKYCSCCVSTVLRDHNEDVLPKGSCSLNRMHSWIFNLPDELEYIVNVR